MTEKITTHNEDALDRIIGQYKNSERLKGILTALCKQIQDLEDAEHTLFGKLDIDNISDILLDKLGKTIGQERLGFSDEIYRILIYTRIAINISGGIPENIINIFRILTQCDKADLRELYPASIQIMADCKIGSELIAYVKNAIASALPACVSLSHIGYFDKENAFTFGNDSGTIDSLHGFGDVNNPETGGKLGVIL